MPIVAALLLAFATQSGDILATAVARFGAVNSYSVTLRSQSSASAEVIRYYYKRPGFVRMEFVTPHRGAVLLYNPVRKKVTLRPFGFLKSFVLTLSPDNRLVKSSKGHRVDRSDIGSLLRLAQELEAEGVTEVVGEEAVGGRGALHLRVTGKGGVVVGGEINSYSLWLDKALLLPIKVISYGRDGEIIEEVLMDDLDINAIVDNNIFDL